MYFFQKLTIFRSAKKWCKDTFFPPSIPFPQQFLQLQQCWHLYCFAILIQLPLLYTVWSSAYSKTALEETLQPLTTSCVKDYKGHSLMQTIFTEPPQKEMQTHCWEVSEWRSKYRLFSSTSQGTLTVIMLIGVSSSITHIFQTQCTHVTCDSEWVTESFYSMYY